MAAPVVLVPSGGLPVTSSAQGVPMTPVDVRGMPVTLVAEGGMPVRFVSVDGFSSYEPETYALLARMQVQPDVTRMGHINTLIAALKAQGIWTALDVFYVLAAHDVQAARLNWVGNPYTLTEVNSPTFETDRGFAGNGSTSYLDTGWAPASGVNWTQNNAGFGIWSRTAAQQANGCAGTSTTASVVIKPRSTTNVAQARVNETAVVNYGAVTDGSGWFTANRTGASATEAYRNAVSLGTGAVASAAVSSANINLGRANNFFAPVQMAAACFGASLNQTEQTDLYTALNTYMTAVGAA